MLAPVLFQYSKLSPLSNLARPSTSAPDAPLPPTPIRTSSLVASHLSTHTSHLAFHHALATAHPAYTSSVRLLQTWAGKRNYNATLGVTDDWWAWCVARTLNWGAPAGNMAVGVVGGDAWAGWRKTVEWLAGVEWADGVWFRVEGDLAVRFTFFSTCWTYTDAFGYSLRRTTSGPRSRASRCLSTRPAQSTSRPGSTSRRSRWFVLDPACLCK